MSNRYTNIVLAIIAIALSAIALQGTIKPAQAQFGSGCGSRSNPCFVQAAEYFGIDVNVTNWPR